MIDERQKVQTTPLAHSTSRTAPCPTIIHISRTPRRWKIYPAPSHDPTTPATYLAMIKTASVLLEPESIFMRSNCQVYLSQSQILVGPSSWHTKKQLKLPQFCLGCSQFIRSNKVVYRIKGHSGFSRTEAVSIVT